MTSKDDMRARLANRNPVSDDEFGDAVSDESHVRAVSQAIRRVMGTICALPADAIRADDDTDSLAACTALWNNEIFLAHLEGELLASIQDVAADQLPRLARHSFLGVRYGTKPRNFGAWCRQCCDTIRLHLTTDIPPASLVGKLGALMSDISETCWYAGWLFGSEYTIPALCKRAMESGQSQPWGHGHVDTLTAARLTRIAQRLGHWANYDAECVYFVPFDPWPTPQETLQGLDNELRLLRHRKKG